MRSFGLALCCLSGNQSQFIRNPNASSSPDTTKTNRQPPRSANTATIGALMAVVTAVIASSALTAWARLAREMTSDNTATALGRRVPPARPVNALNASNVSILGAKADATTATESSSSPPRAIGRRPKESDSGPTETTETPHVAKVAVASCPATATDISKSDAISTSRGGTICTAVNVAKMPSASTARNLALFTSP